MTAKTVFGAELFEAKFASVNFCVLAMKSHVIVQRCFVAKSFRADSALVRFVPVLK